MSGLVLRLDRADPAAVHAAAGAKMGRLAELTRAGVAVPRAFAVTVEAFRRQYAESGPDAPVIAPVRAAIAEAYRELGETCRDSDLRVAVRSSATGEDGYHASFAGVFETVLGVCGTERVVAAVQVCWGSLFAPRARAYRPWRGIDYRHMSMGVGVVEMVDARAAGVAFSAHPVTGRCDQLVVEATWGWGEALAHGLVTPDHIEVGKEDRRVLRYDVGPKQVMSGLDATAGRVVDMPMPERLRGRAVLDDEQISQIVDAVLRIEEHYGYPVDVEWVLRRDGGPVSIVQVRPVTAHTEYMVPRWDPAAAFTSAAPRPGTRTPAR